MWGFKRERGGYCGAMRECMDIENSMEARDKVHIWWGKCVCVYVHACV